MDQLHWITDTEIYQWGGIMKDKLLVIEDDLALRPLWESVARRNFGLENVDWAVSAEEGQKFFQESVKKGDPYSGIVVDLFLAGSDTGLDFIRYARSMGKKTPILLVSSVSESDLKGSFDAMMDPVLFLSKPLSAAKCEGGLKQILAAKKEM